MQPYNSTTSNNEAIRNVDVDTCFLIETFVAFTTGNTGVTPYIVNAALNAILSVVTTIANILVFLAIRKTTSLHLPSKLLLLSLVLTDLAVGSVAQPLFVMFLATKAKGLSDTGVLCFMIVSTKLVGGYMGCVSVMNLTAISLDRYIAFHYHLSYRKIVTTRRVCVSCRHMVVCGVFYDLVALEQNIVYMPWYCCYLCWHICYSYYLYQDIPRVTSSTWPPSTRPSTN